MRRGAHASTAWRPVKRFVLLDGQRVVGGAQPGAGSGGAHHGGRRAGGAHPAAMQHNQRVGVLRFVQQVGGPQGGETAFPAQAAHVGENGVARGEVEPHRGFVQQQQRGAGEQRPGQFGAAALPAGKRAHALVDPLAQAEAAQLRLRAPARLGARQPVQGAVVEQVLPHAQVGIERGLLEHHADPRQRGAGIVEQFAPEDAHLAAAMVEQARQQREERGLARPVGAEQHRELAFPQREGDVLQGGPAPVAVRQAAHAQGLGHGSTGRATMPHGRRPTGTERTTRIAPRSITETSLLTPLVV